MVWQNAGMFSVTRQVRPMKRIIEPNPAKVETEFTDAMLTGRGGWSVLARLAKEPGLLRMLGGCVRVKSRARGASDGEVLWSLVASLCAGNGSLSDLDALRADAVGRRLLGLRRAPSGRRAGEWLSRLGKAEARALLGVARKLASRVAPEVVSHEVSEKGYVPVFVDGTGIEVDGALFEGAGKLCDGRRGHWLHGVFVGGLWAGGRLRRGGVDVAGGWRGQLEHDVAPLLPEGAPVWLRADNAHYRGKLVEFCRERGWDYSISLTDGRRRQPVPDALEGLPESAWEDIGMGERATFSPHRPQGWDEQWRVVARRLVEGKRKVLIPARAVSLASRSDLPLKELVRRHRGKQGQENAFKGPLVELGLHHPPCRGRRANQAFHTCGQLAQLLLVAMQYGLLPAKAGRHGLRPLIRHGVRVVARLVRTGRRWVLRFAKNNFRLDWLYWCAVRLE